MCSSLLHVSFLDKVSTLSLAPTFSVCFQRNLFRLGSIGLFRKSELPQDIQTTHFYSAWCQNIIIFIFLHVFVHVVKPLCLICDLWWLFCIFCYIFMEQHLTVMKFFVNNCRKNTILMLSDPQIYQSVEAFIQPCIPTYSGNYLLHYYNAVITLRNNWI